MDFDSAVKHYNEKYSVLSERLPELIAVRFGLKTSTMLSFIDDNLAIRKLRHFCNRVGLNFSIYERNEESRVIISNKELSEVKDGDDQNKENRFSYPDCCQKAFNKQSREYYHINCIRHLLKDDEYDFRMNPFLRLSPFHLYLHIPCSLRCKKTLEYSDRLLRMIRLKNNDLHSFIVGFNRVPVLYVDICGLGILFRGRASSDSIEYSSFYYAYEPSDFIRQSENDESDLILFKDIKDSLFKGNRLQLHDGRLVIYCGRNKMDEFICPEHLEWKIIDFSH